MARNDARREAHATWQECGWQGRHHVRRQNGVQQSHRFEFFAQQCATMALVSENSVGHVYTHIVEENISENDSVNKLVIACEI